MNLRHSPRNLQRGLPAFTLVEIVMALGICAVALVSMIGLFSVGLKASRDSMNQVQAAGIASKVIAIRSASPGLADSATTGTLAIPAGALAQSYGDAYGGASPRYVDTEGRLTVSGSAAFRVSCSSGTNERTGTRIAQVHLVLSWPAGAAPELAEGKYEVTTYLPTP